MLDKIMILIPPPEVQMNSGQFLDRKDVSLIVGANLPDDYFDIVHAYGEGVFCGCIKIFSPYAEKNKRINIFNAINDERMIYEDSKEDYYNDPWLNHPKVIESRTRGLKKYGANGAGYPFSFFNGRHGLIPWGCWDSAYTFFWNFQDKSKYSIIVYGEEEYYYEYKMTTTEFFYNLITNKISLEGSKIKKLDFNPLIKNIENM